MKDNKNREIKILHKSTSRKYLERMINSKVECMKIAKKFSKDYWDGKRKYGYGGYKYIEGRNDKLVKDLINRYSISNSSKILDVGCGKGYLLYDFKKILPNLETVGLDISKYGLRNGKKEVKKFLRHHDISKKTNFTDNYFDLVLCINTLHNLKINNLFRSIKELDRISKKCLIVVESYRNEEELFNLQCWALTCQSFFSTDEWAWIFNNQNYNKDFDFIFFE